MLSCVNQGDASEQRTGLGGAVAAINVTLVALGWYSGLILLMQCILLLMDFFLFVATCFFFFDDFGVGVVAFNYISLLVIVIFSLSVILLLQLLIFIARCCLQLLLFYYNCLYFLFFHFVFGKEQRKITRDFCCLFLF